jgi:hypothetical protein
MSAILSISASTKRVLKITDRIRVLTKAAEELRKQRELFITYDKTTEIIKKPFISSKYLRAEYLSESIEVTLEASDFYYNIFSAIEVKSIDKKLESIDQKISRLIKLISILKTKFSQLKKLNKRSLFRSQVHLIFKNLDDTHLSFDLFPYNVFRIFQKFKHYPACNQQMIS